MRILGISAFFHDSAAALVEDGEITAAAQEERFSRIRHDAALPVRAVEYCLQERGCTIADIDVIAFYEHPSLKFDRLRKTFLAFAPRGYGMFNRAASEWLFGKKDYRGLISAGLAHLGDTGEIRAKITFVEHHLSHAASSYYPSPFSSAAVLTMDGVGEWTTTSLAAGEGAQLAIRREIRFPHSLGLLYAAFTSYTGFRVNSGEYKVMGLAPYGEPVYRDAILDNLIDVKEDGSFRLNLDYFDFCTGSRMTSERFHQLFGGPPRVPEGEMTQRHMNLAASIQAVTDEVMVKLVRAAKQYTGARHLCLAGGVALNCVSNSRIRREAGFDDIWIQPAAGDAGGAAGAALMTDALHKARPRTGAGGDQMRGAYLGPGFTTAEIEDCLRGLGAAYRVMNRDERLDRTAAALAEGQAVGWFQGRMEFGPRALGNRSILADPRVADMQSRLNLKIKFRESFRPFAPAVLEEEAAKWFAFDGPSPYMLFVADVHPDRRVVVEEGALRDAGLRRLGIRQSEIPAVTHVDLSSRLQTVHKSTNPDFHALLGRFHRRTGCPVLVNTSFNVRGEPIVCTPAEAYRCFMGTGLDVLVLGDCYLVKEDQPADARHNYQSEFAPD